MFLTITYILASLIVVNSLLLIYSCNKTTKKPVIDQTEKTPMYRTSGSILEESRIELAPTGS
jgi:preprotein translocase subunit SecG